MRRIVVATALIMVLFLLALPVVSDPAKVYTPPIAVEFLSGLK
jgi:hypothetical protein